METLKRWRSLHGYIVVFMFLTTISKGSACEAPSSPQCFRRNTDKDIYICEWSMNTTQSDVKFDLYYNETKLGTYNTTRSEVPDERLIKTRSVDIWVKAYVGSLICTSTRTSVVLNVTVKYEAPQNIAMSWINNSLNLTWTEAEKHPALAEIRFRRYEHPTESWENRLITTNTTDKPRTYQVIVGNLLNHSAYQVQIRHKSIQPTINSLWSDWSAVTVPAELEKKPEVTMTTELVNGTRKVTLTWKPMPHAAAVTGVTYRLEDTQSSRGCPCVKRSRCIKNINTCTKNLLYSAVNISISARNAAGHSPTAVIQLPAVPAADLKACDKTLLDEEFDKKTCLELYELQDREPRPETLIILTGREQKKEREQKRKTVKDYKLYLYFEHRCDGRMPQTVKMCLFYQKENTPANAPEGFVAVHTTHSSADLSWKAIPSVAHRGFLTHYSLCSVKVSSQDEPKAECSNISASLIKHRLENLTPGEKYNVSLAGVTRAGEGPKAKTVVNTQLVNVYWSFGLLSAFFMFSTMCTVILKRIKNKIFPPVPTPVIQKFISYPTESQGMLETKEEVDELTLHQLHPVGKSVPEDAEETTVLGGEWDDGTEEDVENVRGDSRMSGGTSDEGLSPGSTDQAMRSSREGEMTDLEEVDNEIAMLIYRNGLVFDVKTDSP